MAWSTPPTFVAGAALPAADLNKLSGDLAMIGGTWPTYTPTWTASTSGTPAVGTGGSLTGAYMQAGKLTIFRLVLTLGTGFVTGTGGWLFGLPATPASGYSAANFPIGVGSVKNAGNDLTRIALITGSSVQLNDMAGVRLGDSTFTWAATNTLAISGTYESA